MFVDSYRVEIENSQGEWILQQGFHPVYQWQPVIHRLFGLFRRVRQEIAGNPQIASLLVKADAHRHARKVLRYNQNQRIRIVRVEREEAHLIGYVIWQDGKWLE